MVLWCDFVSGWVSGMAGIAVGHPIDTVKVRQQLNCQSVIDSIRYVYVNGGGLAFFRGLGAPLLSTGALNSLFFGVYGGSLDLIMKWKDSHLQIRSKEYGRKHEASFSNHFVAGCIGGTAQLAIGCPVDLIKVQLQSQINKSSVIRGPIDCVKQLVRSNGVLGLYKGILPQAMRDIPSSGGYFVIYEYSKRTLSLGKESTKLTQFVAGGIAGMISWWSILPLDVIKSRIQGDCPKNPQYKGVIHCGSIILQTQGIRGLFQGFWPLSIRAFPVNGTTFLVYEYLFKHCKDNLAHL